ncbi:MAG: metallophosphoesterase [Hyphomonadaceae bacterium]|nr:metallophosphoesterase [Hyphomonadaceae bacterium]MCA8886544.1 metallophosphoesterase [Hyphomonadaceae bacterium]
MKALIRLIAASLALLFAAPVFAQTRAEWDGVSRIVVIADLEGDYEKFTDMLRTANLIDAQNNWAGGQTHLVQLGDVPDRGPNSRMIMDLLMRLEPQAQRAGGYVHALIGNHEAMNIEGDLRYTHPGEYAAFATSRSERTRNRYYDQYVRALRRNPPATGLPTFDAAYRMQWNQEHPLGWVEHRLAWSPTGQYGRWIAGHDAVIRINDTLFLHAGLGPNFAEAPRVTMNDDVRLGVSGQESRTYPDIVHDQQGPLWYRGLSLNGEASETANLEHILQAQHVARVIIGHTKVTSTVLPRFNGRVLIADIAVPRGHSDPHAFLIMENGEWTTIHRGQRVPVNASTPEATCAYLRQIAALDNGSGPVAELVGTQCAPAAAN